MPTLEITLSPTELLRAAQQLSSDELETFTEQLRRLRTERRTPHLPEREAALLETLAFTWPPARQARFDTLVRRRRNGTLTPDEHAELVALTDESERQDAARVQAVADLARLRGMTPEEMLRHLGL